MAGFALAGRWRLSLLALAAFLVESANAPIRYAPAPEPSAAARWLAGRPGAVAVLPLGERDTEVMLDGVVHFRPLVNGDSGFMPRAYSRAMELLQPPLGEEAARLLRAIGVRDVVTAVDVSWPERARFGGERIVEVPGGEPATVPAAPGSPRPTLWAAEGVVVETGAEGPVSGAAFELNDSPWIDKPRVFVSMDGRAWSEVPARASLADATLALMRDPRHGHGAVRFAPVPARYLRLDPRLPARPGPVSVLTGAP